MPGDNLDGDIFTGDNLDGDTFARVRDDFVGDIFSGINLFGDDLAGEALDGDILAIADSKYNLACLFLTGQLICSQPGKIST